MSLKLLPNYATDAMNNIKLKTHMLEDLNKILNIKLMKNKKLTNLIESQKILLKFSSWNKYAIINYSNKYWFIKNENSK